MIKYIISTFCVLCLIACSSAPAGSVEGRLMRHPDLHGEEVVFTYEDDLWSASLKGGTAARLTSHPGMETYASYSPDGGMIAFTGSYDGGYDVYVIPSKGGEPIRLTYHPAYDRVEGWTPDGEAVIFISFRDTKRKLYRIGLDSAFPEEYDLDMVSHASISPGGEKVAFNRYYSDRMNWKGYRGGRQQDIWTADIDGGDFEKITEWEGYDNFPMWVGEQIYFNSDMGGGRMNIHVYDLATRKITRCTGHQDWDVEFPSAEKDMIVYGSGGYLWIYDIIAARSRKLEIEIPTDRWQTRDMYISPSNYVQEAALDSDGKRCAVQARGDIYIIETEEERAVNITRTPGSRELHPRFSPDSDTLAFFSDRSGEYELYTAPAEPGAEWKRVTTGSKTYYYHARWSPAGGSILFGDKDYTIYLADIGSGKVDTIDRCLYQKDNEIFWEVSDYAWSSDGRWVVYSKVEENLNSSLFIYDVEKKKTARLTDDRYDDYSPVFGAGGDYIYFLSLRNFSPQLDWMMDNNINTDMSMVMAMQLRSGRKPPFQDYGGDESGKAGGEDASGPEQASRSDSVVIDLEGIEDRIFTVPVAPGTYRSLGAYSGHLTYMSRKSYGFPGIEEFFHPRKVSHYTLHSFDLDSKKDKTVITDIGFYSLSGDGLKAAYMSGPITGVVKTAETSAAGEGLLDWEGLKQKVDVFEEYPQIYRDVWRQIRDFFYDPELHGKDWESIYGKYLELVPHVATRADMNYIIGHMIGELTASHEYIVGQGGPARTYYDRISTGLLGADLAPDPKAGLYRFEKIITGSNWRKECRSPLLAPHIDLEEGDYLVAINGRDVTTAENCYSYLENRAGEKIELTVSPAENRDTTMTYMVETLSSEYRLRYHDEIEKNYEYVNRKSEGRIGYMHLADMDEMGISQFEKAFRAERYRDGLIIDVRGNGGGFVSWFLIDKLERELTYMTVTRDFEPMKYPHGVVTGPVAVLCDGSTGSDGEVFTQHFKDLELGTVIGTPTWGGLIGIINMIPLTDGGMVTQSNVGFADLKGKWIVENRGAQPDIIVENRPGDLIRGKDKQLDLAITYILDKINNRKSGDLKPPEFPVK